MLDGFIYGLIVAFILSLFGIDDMILEVIQPFLPNIHLTTSHYYILFGVIGLIAKAFGKE